MKKYAVLLSLLVIGNGVKAETSKESRKRLEERFVNIFGKDILDISRQLQNEFAQAMNFHEEEWFKVRNRIEFESYYKNIQLFLEHPIFKKDSEVQKALKEAQKEGNNQTEATEKVMNMLHNLIKKNCTQGDLRCLDLQARKLADSSKWMQLLKIMHDKVEKALNQ